jgi:N-dimethylarginine dimethylaminohydrolase
MIQVNVRSETAPLRSVVVGAVKPFSWWDLLVTTKPDLAGFYQWRHNRFSIPNPAIARRQHECFVQALKEHGATVYTVEEVPVSIQLYPRDIAFAIDDVLFLARSRLAVRRREQFGLRTLLPKISRVETLESGTIEGGDVIVDEADVLVGLGEETDRAGIEALRQALTRVGSARRVIPIEFTHRGIVHLDTRFTIVGPHVGVFLPSAFTLASCLELDRRFDLIEATEEEARLLALNTFVLAPGKVVLDARCERIANALEARGITPIMIEFSEITKIPGGFRCATLPLERA